VRDATTELSIHAGTAYTTVEQVAAQIVGVSDGQPVALRQVADVALVAKPWNPTRALIWAVRPVRTALTVSPQ